MGRSERERKLDVKNSREGRGDSDTTEGPVMDVQGGRGEEGS